MIAGFAVECLIKAVWLKNGNEPVRDGEYKGVLRKEGHWLAPLCDRVGIRVSLTERRSLHRLSLIVRSIPPGTFDKPSLVICLADALSHESQRRLPLRQTIETSR
jgi:hypothetical protein